MTKFNLKNRKLLFPIVITFIILLNFFGFNYFIESYKELDDKQNKENIISIINKIDLQYENIKSITKDYANWDDSYEFIQDKNEHYIYNNFRDSQTLLENLNLNFMVFINNDFDIVHSLFTEDINKQNEILNILKDNVKFSKNEKVFKIDENYFLISKAIIKKSDLTGDPKGFILSGTILNLDDSNKIYSNSVKIINSKIENPKTSFSLENEYFGEISINQDLKDKKSVSNIDFSDSNNNTILSIEFVQNRDIYLNGKKHILIFNAIITILCLIMYYIFYKFISYQDKLNKELQKRVEEEISKQREQEQILIQQSKLASMGEMIGNIAHQWRQPLNALGLTIQNINYSYQLGDLDDDFMNKTISKSNLLISNMSKTIDDFRNFFKPNKEKEVFTVNHTVANTMEMMIATFVHLDIKVNIEYEKKDIRIFGLESELSQVLLIILSNAKDALLSDKIQSPIIDIKTYEENKNICISIKDNALGISDDIKHKIFEPYFTTKNHNNGTGMGLYMAKIIVEKNMDGKIALNSDKKGSEFIIKLKMN